MVFNAILASSVCTHHATNDLADIHARQVKKGMQGIDAILYEKKGKGELETVHFMSVTSPMGCPHLVRPICLSAGYPGCFVVTFSRAGEDNKSFK